MSMVAGYGLGGWMRNAAMLLCGAFLVTAPAQARPIRLLILGDSLTAGYGLAQPDGFQAQLLAALKARGRDVTLIDGAVSGDTAAGGRARLDWTLDDPGGAPDAAILELGANDGLRGSDPKQMDDNLTAILDALDKRHVRTLLTGMFAPPNYGEGLRGGVPRRVRPAEQAARRSILSVLPGRRGRRPGAEPSRRHPPQSHRRKNRSRPNPAGRGKTAGGGAGVMRLFVGLELPWELKQRLAVLGGGIPGARWVPADNLHMTLRSHRRGDAGPRGGDRPSPWRHCAAAASR